MPNNQAPSNVVMIRPHHFTPNQQTASDNAFQARSILSLDKRIIENKAFDEVTNVANKLQMLGVDVHLFEDNTSTTPDSVFPNNWFSTHPDGNVYIYPMYAANRRKERRDDVIAYLKQQFHVGNITDLSGWESQQKYLEGTGVLVIDHQHSLAYICHSKRANEKPLFAFCQQQGLTPVLFNAYDNHGVAVYHTNVLMCVTTDFVIIADQMIRSNEERQQVLATIKQSGKQHISLSEQQIQHFAGNMLELSSDKNGQQHRFLAMSQTACDALTLKQKQVIESKVAIEAFSIPTIELAGGSIRCMLAGIHLTKK